MNRTPTIDWVGIGILAFIALVFIYSIINPGTKDPDVMYQNDYPSHEQTYGGY